MEAYLEFSEGKSAKFWSIEQRKSKTTVRYGKIGSQGSTQVKDHGTVAKAEKFAKAQVAAKKKKGYAEKGAPAGHNEAAAPDIGFAPDPRVRKVFDEADKDGSGALSVGELQAFFVEAVCLRPHLLPHGQ